MKPKYKKFEGDEAPSMDEPSSSGDQKEEKLGPVLSDKMFSDLGICDRTLRGLSECKFVHPTEIQAKTIEYSLKGRDVLAAGRTGSGKTLAFLIPVLDLLEQNSWNPMDGLGALIITPTRELAYQIYEVLNQIGKYHRFSVGLVIGGKDLKRERKCMHRCNILVVTPGRLLQHMDENPNFQWDNMKVVVLDEADRILDMGFSKQMNAIIENLPSDRQTLLFSATQTKSVKDLARLSLKKPKMIDVDKVQFANNLSQFTCTVRLEDKINSLWNFIKTHQRNKILIFMATCKQVKFVSEMFHKMNLTQTWMRALHSKLHQTKRTQIYDEFHRKQNGILFATDIAARGLDFPDVHWVIQFDCPEDVDTYVHRVGRTARFGSEGKAILYLMPSEQSFLEKMEKRQIPRGEWINCLQIKITRGVQSRCAAYVELKEGAERAFKAYLKNIYLMKDKTLFQLDKLDKVAYALSMGLVVTPRIRFLENKGVKKLTSEPEEKEKIQGKRIVFNQEEDEEKKKDHNKEKQMSLFDAESDDDADDIFTVKSKWKFEGEEVGEGQMVIPIPEPKQSNKSAKKATSKVAAAKKLLKKNILPNTKITFDDDGNAIDSFPRKQTSEAVAQLDKLGAGGLNIELAKQIMKEEDKVDKQLQKELVSKKKKDIKRKAKMERLGDQVNVTLGGGDGEDDPEFDDITQGYIDALPDPAKHYGKSKDDDDDDDEEFGQFEDEDDEPGKKRRKLVCSSDESEGDEDDDPMSEEEEDLGLSEQQDLALQLIQGNKR